MRPGRPCLKGSRWVGGPAGTRNKVRLRFPGTASRPNLPFLQGPSTASRIHPADKPLRFTALHGRKELEQEGLTLLLSRYAQGTANSYRSQWGWRQLFCRRRGESEFRHVTKDDPNEEQRMLDFVLHSAYNEEKARDYQAQTSCHQEYPSQHGISGLAVPNAAGPVSPGAQEAIRDQRKETARYTRDARMTPKVWPYGRQ